MLTLENLQAHAPEEDRAQDLIQVAERIRQRDLDLTEIAGRCWLENGKDLRSAKALLRHGDFEQWCASELSYSKSSAEKMMRAAEMFAPLIENGTITSLPPATIAYRLSARSVPTLVLEDFLGRMMRAEPFTGSMLTEAIRGHMPGRKPKEIKLARLAEETKKATQEQPVEGESEANHIGEATSTVVDFLLKKIGNEVPQLYRLLAAGGPQAVFSRAVEAELQRRHGASGPLLRGDVHVGASEPKILNLERHLILRFGDYQDEVFEIEEDEHLWLKVERISDSKNFERHRRFEIVDVREN